MYTYAFLKTPDRPLTLPMGMIEPVQLVTCGALSAVVEPFLPENLDGQAQEQLVQACVQHAIVVCQIFEQTTVLPLAFGRGFRSTEDLQTYLHTHQAAYLDQLHRLEGKAEYTLRCDRVPFSAPPTLTGEGGRSYFLAKKQFLQAQHDYQQAQAIALQDLITNMATRYPTLQIEEGQAETCKIYLLIHQTQAPQLQDQLAQWQAETPHWHLSLGNACPPYNFLDPGKK